jgi:phosphatidylglycerol:prolipoprotein diacylglycerol transferase
MTAGSAITALAFVVGALVFYLAARRDRVATEGMLYVALAGMAGGVLGAKLTEWVLVHWSAFISHPASILDPRLGGRTLIGGVLAGWLAVEIAKRRLGIRRSTGDLFALALPAGEAVGRIGCFFNGCCYGVPARVPWAVYQHEAWRHPAQLYASAVSLLIFGALLWLRPRTRREGELFQWYLVLWAAGRFGVEFFRQRDLALGGLSLAQWVCLELAVISGAVLLLSGRLAPAVISANGGSR